MSRKRILLIVEGKKQEVSLFRALFACYRLDLEYEISPYGTNIYELYERMFADGAQDDLTLLGVLKERAPAEDRWLFDQNYSDVLLVFDYEPQDNRFSPERLAEMQRYFNESTDNGKLYVKKVSEMSDGQASTAFSRADAKRAFGAYVSQFDLDDERIALKVEHTYRVADACDAIARGEGLEPRDVDLAWLCGLLHDIGRFEQLRHWDTFNDARSCAHAALGRYILEGPVEGCRGKRLWRVDDATVIDLYPGGDLASFTRDAEWAPVIVRAVGLHSDLSLPDDLTPRERLFCAIVRDADKIDILRVFSQSSCHAVLGIESREFATGTISDVAMRGFAERRCLARNERPESLDGLVGAICLVFELEHATARNVLRSLGYVGELLRRPFGLAPDFSNEQTRARWNTICRQMDAY